MDTPDLHDIARRALAALRGHGFDAAQAGASVVEQHEVNIAHNAPSLLRSTLTHRLALTGLVDGRRASTELAGFDDAALHARVAALLEDARAAPRDDANAVSAGQHARIVQGPQDADAALLADKVRELLAFRERETPRMMIDEGVAAHTRARSHIVTSGGSDLACELGWYSLSAFGTARDGTRSSSFNHAGGDSHELAARPAPEYFGLGAMLRETERQIDTQPIDAKFVGHVVLAPTAVADIVEWLLGQLADDALIAGSSLYRERVGTPVASALLTLKSRFDAPGVAALSADAFVAAPVEVLRDGRLLTLTPGLYASRKTGLPHVPVAGGWELEAGAAPLADLIAAVPRGALVGRLSMGMPASNGDFSGVIKNSRLIADGALGPALSEVMITGNVARMLHEVAGVSRERIDTGAWLLPWLGVAGLHFS